MKNKKIATCWQMVLASMALLETGIFCQEEVPISIAPSYGMAAEITRIEYQNSNNHPADFSLQFFKLFYAFELNFSVNISDRSFESTSRWCETELFPEEKVKAQRLFSTIGSRKRLRPRLFGYCREMGPEVELKAVWLFLSYKNLNIDFKDDHVIFRLVAGAGFYVEPLVEWNRFGAGGLNLKLYSDFDRVEVVSKIEILRVLHFGHQLSFGFSQEIFDPVPQFADSFVGYFVRYQWIF